MLTCRLSASGSRVPGGSGERTRVDPPPLPLLLPVSLPSFACFLFLTLSAVIGERAKSFKPGTYGSAMCASCYAGGFGSCLFFRSRVFLGFGQEGMKVPLELIFSSLSRQENVLNTRVLHLLV